MATNHFLVLRSLFQAVVSVGDQEPESGEYLFIKTGQEYLLLLLQLP